LFVDDPHEPTTGKEWIAAMEGANKELGLAHNGVPHVGHVLLGVHARDELV
jgi:hypothetical protein